MGDLVPLPLPLPASTLAYERAPVLPPAPPTGLLTGPLLSDQYTARPGIGLTAEGLIRIFRMAEHGWPQAQCDVFDDLVENDGHYRGCVEGRLRAGTGHQLALIPGAGDAASIECAAALAESLDIAGGHENLADMLEHELEHVFTGYAGSEIEWTFRDSLWNPYFHQVPHRRFRFTLDTDQPRLLAKDFDLDGIGLEPGRWIFARGRGRRAARAGLHRTCSWFALFKRMAIRDWVVAMKRFGIPHVIGKYSDESTKTAREVLEQAVKAYGDAGSAVIHESTNIEVSETGETAGAREALHPGVAERCDMEVSRLINGNVLSTSAGGQGATFALGRVQEGREFALTRADARRLGYIFRRGVAWPFTQFNGFAAAGAKPPMLAIQVSRDMDPMSRAQLAKVLAVDVGLPLDADQLYEEFGFRKPPSADRATTPGGPAAAAPAKEESDGPVA